MVFDKDDRGAPWDPTVRTANRVDAQRKAHVCGLMTFSIICSMGHLGILTADVNRNIQFISQNPEKGEVPLLFLLWSLILILSVSINFNLHSNPESAHSMREVCPLPPSLEGMITYVFGLVCLLSSFALSFSILLYSNLKNSYACKAYLSTGFQFEY